VIRHNKAAKLRYFTLPVLLILNTEMTTFASAVWVMLTAFLFSYLAPSCEFVITPITRFFRKWHYLDLVLIIQSTDNTSSEITSFRLVPSSTHLRVWPFRINAVITHARSHVLWSFRNNTSRGAEQACAQQGRLWELNPIKGSSGLFLTNNVTVKEILMYARHSMNPLYFKRPFCINAT
jgi:hypothetical protein